MNTWILIYWFSSLMWPTKASEANSITTAHVAFNSKATCEEALKQIKNNYGYGFCTQK